MGHTLVTRFTPESLRLLHEIMEPFGANKIPFGRDCHRETANRELEYHLTLFHWAKARDEYYLGCIRDFRAVPCEIRVTGVRLMHGEEGSLLLYLAAEPAEGFRELTDSLERTVHGGCSMFLHITLAVSRDHEEIRRIYHRLQETVTFPLTLEVEGLDLYHIWRPTKKVRSL